MFAKWFSMPVVREWHMHAKCDQNILCGQELWTISRIANERTSLAGINVGFTSVTRLSQLPDHAKVSGPAEDYILSLHQHFLIHPAACVSRLRMNEIFAKTTLAASVTNALFELCSDVIKGWQNLLKEYMLTMVLRTTPLSKSSSDTVDVDDGGCFGCCCSSCAFFLSSTIFWAVDLLTSVTASVLSHTRFSDSFIPDFVSSMQNL